MHIFCKIAIQTHFDKKFLELKDNWLRKNNRKLGIQLDKKEDMRDITWKNEMIEIDDID